MSTTLIVIHLIITLFLVLVILLQKSDGGGLGSMAGGAGGGMFSPRGGKNFLTRMTGILATAFICSSLVLAYVAKNDEVAPSVVDDLLVDLPTQGTVETKGLIDSEQGLIPNSPIPVTPQSQSPSTQEMEFDMPETPETIQPAPGDRSVIAPVETEPSSNNQQPASE